MGLFIVLEGIEGCGKSTQMALLGDYLQRRGLACVATREPGGTAVGEAIRKIFLNRDNTDIVPLAELLLVTAARVQHVHQVIRPALDTDGIVLCDRFFDATVAYQGYAGGVDLDLIYQSHRLYLDALEPDATLLFDCPVEEGLARSRGRNRVQGKEQEEGRFEDKQAVFHEKVRRGYVALAHKQPERFFVIDARQTVDTVHGRVCGIVEGLLKDRGYAV